MKHFSSLFVSGMVLVVMFLDRPALAADISQCSMVANGTAQIIEFPARLNDGRVLLVKGILSKPRGLDRMPGVLILHGDGSLYTPFCHEALARQFNHWGYFAFIVASSTGTNTNGMRHLAYSFVDQANYARGAVRALRKLPFAAADRLAVWGHSRGGLTAIELATSTKDVAPPFRAIVSAAPHCPAKVATQHTPLLLIVGTDDKRISVSACRDFAAASEHQTGFEALFVEGGDHLYWLQPEANQISSARLAEFLEKHLRH